MATDLAGRRILIVEDEYFIASDLNRGLVTENVVVVGPTGEIPQALAFIDDQPLDAAILDVNLEGAKSYPVADALDRRSIPYMFLTGYDGWALPDPYRHVTRLTKPFSIHAVIEHLTGLVGGQRP